MPNYQPISPENVAGWYWQAPSHYRAVSHQGHLPLSPTEVYPAASVMPVAFVRRGKRVQPVAIVGQHADANLFVGPQGQWLGRYLPIRLRHAPFELVASGKGESVLCVDLDSEWLSQTEGQPFFEEGQPSVALQQVLATLKQWKGERASPMQSMMAALEQYKLLTPWPLAFKQPDGGEVIHEGLYRIDTDTLNALSGDALETLNRVHVLPMIYAHRLSTFHRHLLDRLAAAHAQLKHAQATANIDPLFGEDEDKLSFDFEN